MDEQTRQQLSDRTRRSNAGRRPSWAVRRTRAVLMSVCAAVLAVVLGLGVYSAAEARSTSGVPAGQAGSSGSAVSGAGTFPELQAAGPASGPIDAGLGAEINGIIEANSGYQIGVALMDLSGGADATGTVHNYGVQEAFVAASTAKVLAAAAYYHLVETGGASLDDPLGDYTAGFQLKEMIQESDNDSWSLIMDAVGHGELSEYAASRGLDYSPETNTLTPDGMARILAGLYSGTLLDSADTAQLLSYMQDTNYESLIPAAVPAGVTVFHKYGLLDDELHDAAILAGGGSAYALVIYTKGEDLADVPERTEVIHQLTEAVADALF
jgi:beta-lactamase class A